MKKQTISFLLSLVLLLSLFPVLPVGASWYPDSGTCGENVTWRVDRETGTLYFEGFGQTYDAGPLSGLYDHLWWAYGEEIQTISFVPEITALGSNLFDLGAFSTLHELYRLRNVRTLCIPENITLIGSNAFRSLNRLDEITILNPNCQIGNGSFTVDFTLGNPERTVVVGYPGSTAESYAAKYGYTFRAISCDAGAHVYQDTVVTPQTCTEAGLMDSECVICGYKTQRPIPAGHDYAISERLARTTYTCVRCGDSYVAGECVAITPNESVSFEVQAGAYPCLSFTPEMTDYYTFRILQNDAWSVYNYADSYGYIYNSAGELVEANYSSAVLQAGETYYYRLPQVYDDNLSAHAELFITHEYEMIDTQATCTEDGMATYSCVHCGNTYREYRSALGHDFIEEIITEASCTQEGLARRTCSRCGYSETEILPKSHQYYYDVWLPWYHYGKCERCGEEDVYGLLEPPFLETDKTLQLQASRNDTLWFRFTPGQTDLYAFDAKVDNGYYSYTPIYDAYGNYVGFHPGDIAVVHSVMTAGETYYCKVEVYSDDPVGVQLTMKLVHDYFGEITRPATCTNEGEITYSCYYCRDTYVEKTPEEHEWEYDVILPWYQHAVCTLCGKEQDFGTKTPPALTLGQESVPVFDENSAAYFSFTPEVRDRYYIHFVDTDYYDAYIDLFNSDGDYFYGGWYELGVTLEAGQTYYYRFSSYGDRNNPPPVLLEQVHSVWYETVTQPSCTEDGLRRGVCEYCGETVSEIIPASHEYDFDVTLPWYKHGVCMRCGNIFEDGSQTPPELHVDQTQTAKLDAHGSEAFFRFTPEKTGSYSVDFGGISGIECYVFSSNGDYCAALYSYVNDDNNLILHAGWTYYFRINNQLSDEGIDIPITLHLVEEQSEPALQTNERKYVQMSSDSPQLYFSFMPEKSGYYKFYSDSVEGFGYPSSILYDESGSQVFRWGSNNFGFEHRAELEAGHTYHLKVTYANSEDHISFYVSVEQIDSLFQSTELTLNKPETAYVPPNDLHEVFRFIPEETGEYMFSADSGENTCCWLLDSALNTIGYSEGFGSNPDFRLVARLTAGQTYYFEPAFRYIGSGGSFPVVLEKVGASEPIEIAPGESKNTSITVPGAEVDFSFTPEKTDLYAFYSTSENDTYCLVYDAFGNRIADDDDSGDDSNFWLELPLEGGKPYQFAVHLYNSQATGSFQVSLQQVHSFNVYEAAPTCTEAGGTVYTCEFCGERHTEDVIPALGHSFGEWAVKKAAACTEAGEESRVCARCGEEETRDVAALGHDWGEAVYAWSENNGEVIATHACRRDPSHTETETVKTVSRVTKEATAEAEGEMTVTASFTNAAFAAQSKTVAIPKSVPDKPAKEFTDMPAPGHWAHDAIAWAVEKGVTTGTSETTFSPDSGCTRAQVVTFLWRAAGKPEPKSAVNPFTDVASDAYYRDAVLWALGEGITTGTSDTKFSPNAVCTRAQIVTFLWRFSGSKEAEKAASFSDVVPGAYYEKAVSWAAETGVTTGTSDTTFSPNSTCTRAQVVTFLYRDIVKNAG